MLDTFRKRDNRRDHLLKAGMGVASGRQAPGVTPGTKEHVGHSAVEPQQSKYLQAAHAASDASSAAGPLSQSSCQAPRSSNVHGNLAHLIVGPEIKLKGAEITDCDTLIVEGLVEACMRSRVVEVSEAGTFRGKVEVEVAEIRGRLEGELTVHKQLTVRSSGKIAGKIRYGKILIDEGGEITGDVAPAHSNGAEASSRTTVYSPPVRSSDAATEYLPRELVSVDAGANRVSTAALKR